MKGSNNYSFINCEEYLKGIYNPTAIAVDYNTQFNNY